MIIRPEAIRATLPATDSSDPSRFYLRHILADPAKRRVVATNGHVLIIATDKAPQPDEDFPAIENAPFHGNPPIPISISAELAASMLKTAPRKGTIDILRSVQLSRNGSDQTATIAATDLQTANVAKIDAAETGRFPDYERVMVPNGRPGVQVCMAVDVLETLIKAAKAVGGKNPKITFDVPTESKHLQDRAVIAAIGIEIHGSDVDVTGCAMPCRM
jgi:hypothetical protein